MGIRGTRHSRGDVCALAIAVATAGAALCPPAHAADLNATANAAVVRPNTLIKTDDLDFGTLLSGPAGGSVTINPVTNGRSAAGGATLVGNDGRRAVFQGTLTRAGGGAAAMTASLVRAATTSGGGIALLGATLLPRGVQTYFIGGTLTVPANQPAGDYSGTFTLTVNYL